MKITNAFLQRAFAPLTTSLLADACVRLDVDVRAAPAGARALHPQHRLAGRVRPIQYAGGLDLILEAMQFAQPGDVLLIDNAGRRNDGCVDSLLVLEAQLARLGGFFVWGCHRHTAALMTSALPLFSYGSYPAGGHQIYDRTTNPFEYASLDDVVIIAEDLIFADQDGAVFLDERDLLPVLEEAATLRGEQDRQLKRIRAGLSFRAQINFDMYLEASQYDPGYTFVDHLRTLGRTPFDD